MKYQMPEPFEVFTEDEPNSIITGYTATQVQAAYEAGRVAGLEEAAEDIDDKCRERIMTASDCIDAIRNLAKETP